MAILGIAVNYTINRFAQKDSEMSTKQETVMGAIGTTLYCISFVGLFAMPILLLYRRASVDEWFDVMLPIVLAFSMLSYMGKYYCLQKEFDEFKQKAGESKLEEE